MALTDKQKRFCEEYVVDLNATQAAIRAGYSEKGAKVRGADLLTNVNVKSRIAELQKAISDKLDFEAIDVVREVARLAFSDVTSFLENPANEDKQEDDEDNEDNFTHGLALKKLEDLTPDQTRCIAEIRPTQWGIVYKLHSKTDALEKLMKHLGLYDKDNTQKKQDIVIEIKPNDDTD